VTTDAETRKTYRNSGFTGILPKPIKLNRLRELVVYIPRPRRPFPSPA